MAEESLKHKLDRNLRKAHLPPAEREFLLSRIEQIEEKIWEDVKDLTPDIEHRLHQLVVAKNVDQHMIEAELKKTGELINIAGLPIIAAVLTAVAKYGSPDFSIPPDALERITTGQGGAAVATVLLMWAATHMGAAAYALVREELANRRKLDGVADAFDTYDGTDSF
ncbi:hypothetical protein K2Y00_02085 [Patescibacteria group bacterium]|nr:hypothetical protein [Patescibacteria group bacterium]